MTNENEKTVGGVEETPTISQTLQSVSAPPPQVESVFTESWRERRNAYKTAAANALIDADLATMDETSKQGLFRAATRALFDFDDPDGRRSFGSGASKNWDENIERLRRFVKGDFSAIETDDMREWEALGDDEEKRFQYALKHEAWTSKQREWLKGNRKSIQVSARGQYGQEIQLGLPDFLFPEKDRERNYDSLSEEEKAQYRKNVIDSYEKTLLQQSPAATFMKMTYNLSDAGTYLVSKAYNSGNITIDELKRLEAPEREQVLTALSLMRGYRKRGKILGVETDFTDETKFNRFQLNLYGFQNSLLSLASDTADFGKSAWKWARYKMMTDEAQARRYKEDWDLEQQIERALDLPLPEGGFWGAMTQGVAENVHWFIPYGAAAKGAGKIKTAKEVMKTLRLTETAAKANALTAMTAVRKAEIVKDAAAVEKYTAALRLALETERTAQAGMTAAQRMSRTGRAISYPGMMMAYSAFAEEYLDNADAAGISRTESLPTAAAVGALNAAIERFYVPGLESRLTPAQIKSVMWSSLREAWNSAGAAGARKKLAEILRVRAAEGARVFVSEGLFEEPLQQITTEMGKAVDAKCAELRKTEGGMALAEACREAWEALTGDPLGVGKRGLAAAWGIFIDTAAEVAPSSLGFGLTTIGFQTNRQHVHNYLERRKTGDNAYEAGYVDMVSRVMASRKAIRDYWEAQGLKADSTLEEQLTDALSRARDAFRRREGAMDVDAAIREAAGVDARTAGVIRDMLEIEENYELASPRYRAWRNAELTNVAEVTEDDVKALLPGYVEGSFKADRDGGVFSAQVKLPGVEEPKTIAYRIVPNDELFNPTDEDLADDSPLGVSYETRRNGDEKVAPWSKLSMEERRTAARSMANSILRQGGETIEFTNAEGKTERVDADAVIALANGRIADVAFRGAMARGSTLRHETWHALWRFTRSTLPKSDVDALYAAFPHIDPKSKTAEAELDEAIAAQFELYASGNYVPPALATKFERWTGIGMKAFGKILDALGAGRSERVVDPATGKPFTLQGFYDAVLAGRLGTGALGITHRATGAEEKKETPAAPEETAAPETKEEATPEEAKTPEKPAPEPVREAAPEATLENPASPNVPDQRFYRISAGNGVSLVGELVVSDAADLHTSYKGNLTDPRLQNRGETNEGKEKVLEIASEPDPLQVGTVQPRANNGFTWALPNGDVFIGNTRVSGISQAYENGNAEAVRAYMLEEARRRGITVREGVENPIVHFVLRSIESKDGSATIYDVVRQTNESINRGMNVEEQAKNDSDLIEKLNIAPDFAFTPDGRIDTEASREAINAFARESGAQGMIDPSTKLLTDAGQKRLANAIVVNILGSAGSLLSRRDDLDVENELRALTRMAPRLMHPGAKLLSADFSAYDLRGALAEIMPKYAEWLRQDKTARVKAGKQRKYWYKLDADGNRAHGVSWERFISQGDLFEEPSDAAKQLGQLLADSRKLRSFDSEDAETEAGRIRAQKHVVDFFTRYFEQVDKIDPSGVDLFGEPPISREALMRNIADSIAREEAEAEGRFSVSAAALRRDYDEVVRRYTNADGTKKRGWMKAPNGKPTKLNERQWVLVRTPAFKEWFGDWEAAELQRWLEGSPVASATGHEYENVARSDLEDAVVEFFKNRGVLSAENADIGKVNITRSGIHDSIFKGVGRTKIAAFNYLPEIIANGRVVSNEQNWKERGYNSAVIAAPISVGGKAHVAFVVVRRHSNGDNNFYLHEVGLLDEIKKEAERLDDTGLSPDGAKVARPLGSIKSIAYSLFAVKGASRAVDETDSLALDTAKSAETLSQSTTSVGEREFPRITDNILAKYPADFKGASRAVDENGEPLVVYHGSRWNPLAEAPGNAVFGKSNTASQGTYLKNRQGFFFANKEVAENYGIGSPAAFFINTRNPYVVDVRDELRELDYDIETEREEAEAAGYPIGRWLGEGNADFEANDSATAYLDDNMDEIMDRADVSKADAVLVRGADGSFVAVAFEPTQIKSATDNTGSFDGGEGDIRASVAAAALRRDYDAVVARYTNADGTKKRGWMKAPNGRPTLLDERQWVLVRTPAFKEWFGDWEAAELQRWLEGSPVAHATGKEYEGMSRSEIVNAVFKNWERVNHKVVNNDVGEVELSRSGIHDSMAHGIGRNKLAAFDFIPEIIANGRVVRFRENWEDRGYDSHIIAAPISIGGKPCVALAIVNRSANGNRFYLHEVGIIDEIKKYAEAFRTGSSDVKSALSRNLGDVRSIAYSLFAVKGASRAVESVSSEKIAARGIHEAIAKGQPLDANDDDRISKILESVKGASRVVDENGEPMVVYHGTNAEFNAFEGGAFFTDDYMNADGYANGERVLECFLDIKNPLVVDCKGRKWDELDTPYGKTTRAVVASEEAKKHGGVVFKNVKDSWADDAEAQEPGTVFYVRNSAQAKSATDNTGAFDGAEGDIRFSVAPVYTGSAADYANRSRQGGVDDGPSVKHIGTGEGSQVYGWGLYGSTVRGVAEGYAQAGLQKKHEITHNGKPIQRKANPATAKELAEAEMISAGDVKTAASSLAYTANFKKGKEKALYQAAAKYAADHADEYKQAGGEHLYEQTFFTNRAEGDDSHLLKWYEPVSEEQKQWIIKGLVDGKTYKPVPYVERRQTDVRKAQNGGEVYQVIEKALGSPQAASEFLARAGIDGIKYPVDSYGGKGVKDGDEAGWNYVSFRDDNIRVDHKWTDGEERFSVVTRVFNPDAQVAVVDGRIEPVFKNLATAEIRNYIRDRYMGREVTIDSDGTLAVFRDAELKAAMKKRGKHRRVLHALDALVKNAHYTRFEPNDGQEKHAHLIGQFVYTAAIRLADGVYGVELKLDIPKSDPEKTRFKGQTLKTKIADAVLSAQTHPEGRLTPASDYETSAAETIRLGDIVSTPQIIPQSAASSQGGAADVRASFVGMRRASRLDLDWARGAERFSVAPVYTGSAADYANRSRQGGVDDGPSVKHIGTGEGSQVYGWGLRGTTIRKNAERDSFGKRQKNLYKQTFFTNRAPGDESHLLDWNGTTTLEQKQWFADEANKEFGGNWIATERGLREGDGPRFDDDKGWKLYNIAKMLVARNKYTAGRVEQLASEFLYRAGIDGVKAPDIRYGKTSDKDEFGNIYVAFSDEHIRVDHKWTDGKERFSVVSINPNLTQEVSDAFSRNKDGFYSKSGGTPVRFAQGFPILSFLGVRMDGIFTTAERIRKMANKHFLTQEQIASLPTLSDAPAAVFLDVDGNGAHVILTDALAPYEKGNTQLKPVMIWLEPSRHGEGFIASAYSRSPKNEAAYTSWRKKLRYLDANKIAGLNLEEETDSLLRPQASSDHVSTPGDFTLWQSTPQIIPQSAAPRQGGVRDGRSSNGQPERFSVAVTPEEDAAYMDAVKRGDMEAAQRLLKAAWERNGYTDRREHLDAHGAPSASVETEDFKNLDALREAVNEDGYDANLWAIAHGISAQPEDYWSDRGPRLYGYNDTTGNEAHAEIARAIRAIQSGAKPLVTVYRAVPKDVKAAQLQSGGEWVSPSNTYAENHGKSRFGEGNYKIIREDVRPEHLWWDANDAREWGYDDGRQYVYANAPGGSKLATVTYDDAGNVIPLSQRFNPQREDIRFSIASTTSGERFVLLDRQINDDWSDKNAVRKNLSALVGSGAISLADSARIEIGKELPKEYTRSNNAEQLYRNKRLRKIRGKLARHFDELITVSSDRSPDSARDKEREDGVYYYRNINFGVKGHEVARGYSAKLLSYTRKGVEYIYDIVDIKDNSSLSSALNAGSHGGYQILSTNNGEEFGAHSTISAPSRQGGAADVRASFAKRPFAFDGQPLKDPHTLYQQMNRLDDVSLYAAALACKMAVSGAKSVKESTVVEKLHDIYPERKREDLARMAFGIKNRAEAYAKRIKEDLNRGVTESAIVKHIPDDAREAFAGEIRDEALRGRNLGAFGQRVSQEIRNRQAKVFADAVKIQTGMEASLFESFFGFDLASTIEGLANNPYLKRMELKDEERRKKRMEQKAAQKKDAAAQEEAGAGEAEEDAKPELPALSLEDPHALAMKLVDMCREYWNAKHGFRKEYNPFSHAVALQFLRKTLANIYSKLADDLVYSRMRETVRNHIAKLENCPTVRGIEGEATFLGQLINAKRIRQTAQELCEQLSTFLKTKFEASGQFDPAVEELKRRVPAVLQRMARYARHAIWLTPEAAMLESAELQKEIAAATQEFDEFDADSADSRIINENTLKLNVLREFGALKYKPIAQIEEAIAWWENAQDEGAEKIFNAWNEREKRTERIANILAAAFRNPSVKARFAKEGRSFTDVVNDYLQGHMGFINLLRDLMRFAPAAERAAAGEYLRQIELEIQKAGTRAETAKRNAAQELVRAAEEIYGKPFSAVLRDMVKVDERFMPFMGQVDNGKTVAPTKGRAMQLLASLLQLGRRVSVRDLETGEDVDTWIGGYWDNIVANGREGQAEKIAALLTVEDMNMLAWMRGWYERNRQSLSDISQRIFGVGVYAETGNYMPVKMLVDPQGLEKATSVGWSVFPKSLTPRVRNLRDFDTSADVFQMFFSRMHEAEQWKAHAELGLELRGIFGRSELQKALRASHGDKARRLLLGFITDILAGHGAAETGADGVRAFTDTVRGWAAVGALGGNLGVMLKQPTSIPAFAFEIGLKKTATFIASAFSPAGLEAMGEIWRSQERVNRWHGGYSEEIANALRDKNPGPLKKALLATMVTNRLGDIVPALVVGQGIYRDYLAQGYSKEDAMAATWILVERTQQSSRIENRAGFQRRHPLGNTIYQFLTTQQQYLQYEIIALREAINEPRNSAKWTKFATATVLNHFILSSAYFWMGQLYRALLGQPPPKEQLQDWVIAMLLGPYGALYGLGITSSDAISEWVKGYKFGKGQSIPSLSFVGNIFVRDPHRIVAAMLDKRKSWSDVLDETGRWISDFNSLFRDARKVYRYRIKGEK